MNVIETSKNFSQNMFNGKKEESKLVIKRLPRFVKNELKDKVETLQHAPRRLDNGVWSVSVCFCSEFLNNQIFDCHLFCFDDVAYKEEIERFNSTDTCVSDLRKRLESSCAKISSNYWFGISLLITCFIFSMEV